MQSHSIKITRSAFNCLILLFGLGTFLAVESCNEEDKTTTACIVLQKTSIDTRWVSPGLTNPARPATDIISYVTFTLSPNASMDAITVNVQGYNTDNLPVGERINLNDGNPCPVSLTGVEYGTNSIDLSSFQILNDAGALKPDFEKIILTPVVFADPASGKNYVKLDASVDYSSGEDLMVQIMPCPPCNYCRPPCRDSTEMMSPGIDTTKIMDTVKKI